MSDELSKYGSAPLGKMIFCDEEKRKEWEKNVRLLDETFQINNINYDDALTAMLLSIMAIYISRKFTFNEFKNNMIDAIHVLEDEWPIKQEGK